MTMTTIIVLLVVALAIWAYIDFNAAKATGRWFMVGVKGVGNDIQAIKHDAQAKQVADPHRQDNIYNMLNEDVVDLDGYRKSARGRRMASHKLVTDAIAKIAQ